MCCSRLLESCLYFLGPHLYTLYSTYWEHFLLLALILAPGTWLARSQLEVYKSSTFQSRLLNGVSLRHVLHIFQSFLAGLSSSRP